MQPHERAHAFYINVMALSSHSIKLRAQLNALGHQLIFSATMDGVIHDWLCHYNNRWTNVHRLDILSFLDTKGNQVVDTTTSADPAILLLVVNGAVSNFIEM